jgi:Leucine-rich repeat (LRR) protein
LLIQLNLSDNTLTGPLPEALSLLTQLRQMHLGTNQFTGMLPVNVLGALGKPGNLRLLDLSDNALVVTDYEATLLTAKLPTGCEINLDPTSDPAEAKS